VAETLTTRFGLTNWGASTDGPSRLEFNNMWAQLEAKAGIDTQGLLSARPVAGQAQRYYYATDTGVLYRDNGTAWKVVGAALVDAVATGSTTGTVPLTVNALAGQTADLFQAQVNGTVKWQVSKDGNATAQGTLTAANAAFTSTATGTQAALVKGMVGQTADVLAVQDYTAANLFRVSPTGQVTSPFLASDNGKGLIGGATYTALAYQTRFPSGNPALEVRSTVGGTGTYADLVQIRHPQWDGTAVLRRLGVQLKLGDEVAGDVTKAGGMYLESSAANAANPSLILFQADTPALTIPATGQVQLNSRGLATGDSVDINRTGASSLRFNSAVEQGAQGTSIYTRAGSSSDSFYWYAAGVHSDTPGAPGAGGTTAAQLTSAGLLTLAQQNLTSTNAATLAQANPAWMIGASGATNLIADRSSIQARNNGAAAKLTLNPGNGDIDLGTSTSTINAVGTFKIAGTKVTIAAAASPPASPATGDIWIQNA
jgi:hypothetical protein